MTTDRAVLAAIERYDERHRALIADAQAAEADKRPLTARKLRYKASIVARAALAEEMDTRPAGLTVNDDGTVNE